MWVVLWTDLFLFGILVVCGWYVKRVRRDPPARARWGRVLSTPGAASAVCILAVFVLIALVDSIHLRMPLTPTETATGVTKTTAYRTQTESLLDLIWDHHFLAREKTYSAPLAYRQWTKEALTLSQGQVRDFPRLQHGGAHLGKGLPDAGIGSSLGLKTLANEWREDVIRRLVAGLISGWLIALILQSLLIVYWSGAGALPLRTAWLKLRHDPEWAPRRAVCQTFGLLLCLAGVMISLGSHYHVLGTDRTGNDVLWQALKSLRTAWVIGLLTTLSMLPLALALGLMAGYFKSWVDDLIQYLYTTLSSIPGVLLIAACVLMIQAAIDAHGDWFPTSAERADIRLLMLCLILGLTGWAGLCRLLRGETLKLRELEYVQAARAFGVPHQRVLLRHLLPNVAHLVLITVVLEFSGLVLYEAVLSYIGVGVDASTQSFGSMINLARLEMSGSRMIWWNLLTAFSFMLILVLAANVLSDAVRDAFDPRAARFRPRPKSSLNTSYRLGSAC